MNFMAENEYVYEASKQAIEGKSEFSTGLSYRLIPEFALGLEAREQDGGGGVPEMTLQMMADPARVAHSARGDHDPEAACVIDGPALVGGLGEMDLL